MLEYSKDDATTFVFEEVGKTKGGEKAKNGNKGNNQGYEIWLLVWNMNFILPYIRNFIIPSDFHIFQRGRLNHQPVR
jgi:hypothetical protein